ncbi:hypothetical protein OWR29_24535 [Actinoplanes sp. Pm04-4]|uniref:Tetratricopeptide repeat protein n=1 Tax=Paractinoplanes pyxinae TaxID=2997416 RepID=A0ABT4B3V2_9ACTN|nr:hypothetical protein [Actinoplanes pyxinae]MCY1141179.1 hypothetical protein [Actinoplanes pyxinae]
MAQLYGAGSVGEAREVARLTGGGYEYEATRRIAAWLHQLYPDLGDGFWALLPAAVRNRLSLPAVRRDSRLLALLPSVSDSQAARALEALVPACREWPDLTEPLWAAATQRPGLCARVLEVAVRTGGLTPELLALVRRTLSDPATSVAVLHAVVDGVPAASVVFAGRSVAEARELADGYVRLAGASAPHRAALADAVHERGLIWEREGRDDMALQTAEYEVNQRRSLQEAAPASGPEVAALARALTILAVRQDRAGQPRHAHSAVAEAVRLHEQLPATAEPGAAGWTADVAYTRAQQARILGRLGRVAEAAEAAREATTRYRELAATDRAAHGAGLADALLIEAAQARARDQHDLAVAAGAEAVEQYERLAAADPARHRARLAYACCAYGMDLGDFRSHEAGLAQLERAEALYRSLDPPVLPGLAAARLGRGLLLAELERWDAATQALGAAVEVYRQLPDRATALAGALATQAQVTAEGGDLAAAVALLTEACELGDRLHAADPLDAALRADLAAGYQNLSRLYERRGDGEAAYRAALRARLLLGDEG